MISQLYESAPVKMILAIIVYRAVHFMRVPKISQPEIKSVSDPPCFLPTFTSLMKRHGSHLPSWTSSVLFPIQCAVVFPVVNLGPVLPVDGRLDDPQFQVVSAGSPFHRERTA
jgi:hypothetical protein